MKRSGSSGFTLDAINRRTWQAPATVRACERLAGWTDPGARIEHMDARNLSAFQDGRFALAVCSFNGIDAVVARKV